MEQEKNSLKHYGVKGMKWGVRKQYKSTGRKKNKKIFSFKKSEKKTAKKEKNESSSNKRYISDEELRRRINRLKMEKEYKQLTAREKSAGQKWIEGVLSDSSRQIAVSFIKKYADKTIDKMLNDAAKKATKA